MPESTQYAPDASLFTAVNRFRRLLTKGLRTRLAPYDVSPGQLSVLHFLWQRDDITQKQLRELVDLEQATLSNTLKRMARDGLVDQVRRTGDRRTVRIVLTQKGKDVQAPVEAVIEDVDKTLRTGLTINDRKYFRRILQQRTDRLHDEFEEPVLVLFDEVED